jgi:hypothetical protein
MRKRLVLVLVPLLMATTCVPRVSIQGAPSPAARPAFAFSTGGAPLVTLREFQVTQCRPGAVRRPLWQVRRHHSQTDTLVTWDQMRGRDGDDSFRITYGQVPEGFGELVAPEPLVAGRCYLAVANIGYGGGSREFSVTPDGRVELGKSGGYYGRGDSELNRAGVHCKRLYYAARAPADTVAADARAFAVADTSITCGTLRREHPFVLKSALSRELRVAIVVAGAASIAWGLTEEIFKE